jgi:hypothetical protein
MVSFDTQIRAAPDQAARTARGGSATTVGAARGRPGSRVDTGSARGVPWPGARVSESPEAARAASGGIRNAGDGAQPAGSFRAAAPTKSAWSARAWHRATGVPPLIGSSGR